MGLKVSTRTASGRVSQHFDTDALLGEIRQQGAKASAGVTAVIRSEAKEIRDLARDYAPHDDGYLEKAIKVENFKEEGGRPGSIIYVDGDMPGSHDSKTVGDYAILMHEGLGPYGSGRYKPGEGTLAKIYAGFKAGGKFLERAMMDRRKELFARALAAVKKVTR